MPIMKKREYNTYRVKVGDGKVWPSETRSGVSVLDFKCLYLPSVGDPLPVRVKVFNCSARLEDKLSKICSEDLLDVLGEYRKSEDPRYVDQIIAKDITSAILDRSNDKQSEIKSVPMDDIPF